MASSTDWRTLAVRSQPSSVEMCSLSDRRPFKLSKATCAAAHSDLPCLAVGGLKSSSGSFLVQAAQALPRPAAERPAKQYACRLSADDKPTSLAWRDSTLLCGGSTGRAYLFHADPAELAQPRQGKHATELGARCEYAIGGSGGNGRQEAAPPGHVCSSRRVSAVGLYAGEARFAAVENDRLHVWDIERPEAPVASRSCDPDGQGLLCLSMAPFDTTCVVAGYAGRPHICDQNTGAWACHLQAGGSAIRAAQWHPMVPYWLAVGRDDGAVAVHDIRMPGRSEMRVFEGHYDAVLSLSWSPKHGDLLASGSADHCCKLWSLEAPAPHGIVATWSGRSSSWASAFPSELDGGGGALPLLDSVVAVDFCRTEYQHGDGADLAGQCFVTCADGSVSAIRPAADLLRPLVQTRLDSLPEQDVERALYERNFDEATGLVLGLAQEYLATGDAERAEHLMQLLEPQKQLEKTCADAGDWSSDVHAACYAIPANFDRRFAVPVQQSKVHSLNQLRLGLRISALVRDRRALEILGMEKEMLRVLADTGYMATGQLLDTMFRLVARHDRKSALELGSKMGGLLLNQNRHGEFRRITFLLLYPTVYDTAITVDEDDTLTGELIAVEEVNECLADTHAALDQLTLHRAVLQLVDEAKSTEKAENIMETVERFFMQEGREIFHILSRDVVLRYLQSLLELWQYDTFFAHVMELNDRLEGLPFGEDVLSLAKEVIQTDLPRWVEAKARGADFGQVGHVAAVVSAIIHTVDEGWLELATRPSFSEMLGELETVLEELLRAMSADEAVVAARDVAAAIRAGCDVGTAGARSAIIEDVVSMLQLLDDFAA